MGWVEAGPVLLRLDVAERIGAELAAQSHGQPMAVPSGLAPRLSVRAEALSAVLRRLGFTLRPAPTLPAGHYGPPAPAMMTAMRRKRDTAPVTAAREGPFSALAALRP
jgi:ATP-dependent RNA helicase SUPV3L1/SUV3